MSIIYHPSGRKGKLEETNGVNQSNDNKKDFPAQYQEVVAGNKKLSHVAREAVIYPRRLFINPKDPIRAANTTIVAMKEERISSNFISEFIDELAIGQNNPLKHI